MIKEVFFTGKTIEEAWANACKEMNYDPDDKCYQIVDMGKKGFLGIGSTPAKIKIEVEVHDAPKPKKEHKPAPKKEHKPAPKAEKPAEVKTEEKPKREVKADPKAAEKTKLAEDYIRGVLEAMEITGTQITSDVQPDGAVIKLEGEDLGVVIGRRGETLDSLQYLASLVANRDDNNFFRIALDSGDYRAKREQTLRSLARRMSASALKRGRNVTLEPMNPYERRIIHATVATIDGVNSKSVGDEPNRRVIITVAGSARRDNDRRGGRGRGGRSNRGDRGERPQAITTPNPNATPVKDEAEKPLYSKIEL